MSQKNHTIQSKRIATRLQKEVFDLSFGNWIPTPTSFIALLTSKKLTALEYCIFNFIFSECYRVNKYSLNFSKRFIEKKLKISDRTAWKALKSFEALKLISRHYSTDLYGEVYTLNSKALRGLLGTIELLDRVERGVFARITPLRQHAFVLKALKKPDAKHRGGVIATASGVIPTASGVKITANDEPITPNSIYLKELYSLYRVRQAGHSESSFMSDCNRLIADGFNVELLKVFLSNDKNDLTKIKSIYAVVKKIGKENLGRLESQAKADGIRIQAAREDNAKLIERSVAKSVNSERKKGPIKSITEILKSLN